MLEMLQLLPLRPDIIIVAGYGAATDAGVYSLAVSITAVGWVLPQAVGTIALPLVASDVASSADATAGEGAAVPRPLATRALRHGVLLSIVAGVGVGAMLLAVPPIFGEDFDRTVGLGLIMLPGVIALALGRVMIGLLLGLGRANAVLAIGLAVVPPALAAYLLAVPGGGPTAAAIVSGAAYLLTTLGASLALRREGLRLSRAALTPRRADLRDYLPARRP
jgi:O-antigen/teichoic acid export membrane protein